MVIFPYILTMTFKVIIFNSFSSKFVRICISFFNIAAKRTCSGSAINVYMYVFLYVCVNDCRPIFIKGHNSPL